MDINDIQKEQEDIEYIENTTHLKILEEYWNKHEADGVLDDDIPDAFNTFLENAGNARLREIINENRPKM